MAGKTPQATFLKGVVALDGLPAARIPEIAVSGRSNVGKSSLLNTLFRRKALARISSTPGKTREINYFNVEDRFHLVDLPGYGYARVPGAMRRKWGSLVENYLASREQLVGVVQLVDLRHDPTALDRDMLGWLASQDIPTLVVGTKMDKLKRGAAGIALGKLRDEVSGAGFSVEGFSCVTRVGRKPVWKWIDDRLADWSGEARTGSRNAERD
ncbi:MAG: ribosome biogenesis GTP-binding protein YihA/YsxC [Gemmatimonadota bacterium]|jgi:GTP-binding protein|nr:ribosome biogenesis GTP-binding protein YihA/YsxC [Gemmatimonadota bacterium]MDP6529792.1 ribosome biogenesis GTP-binding protein YihA/YsxC [Gemmatimonadota bacterium]MDP6802984.1 ribosome biogenesis GTP-binding protein YihA/YsxC [Gemmatimonadota bacterium]MDP7032612.1 ribosome biogenesis GTP-binding protein YihA/YsxC [Gemmatimonadota bacterium]